MRKKSVFYVVMGEIPPFICECRELSQSKTEGTHTCTPVQMHILAIWDFLMHIKSLSEGFFSL